jgi:hypothetical protein
VSVCPALPSHPQPPWEDWDGAGHLHVSWQPGTLHIVQAFSGITGHPTLFCRQIGKRGIGTRGDPQRQSRSQLTPPHTPKLFTAS